MIRPMKPRLARFMFKDQFVSLADLWRFKRLVIGRTLHVGQHVGSWGMRASTRTSS